MEFDAIVIGGGLAGTATAYYLAKAGVGTLLLERGDLNTQASGSNAGSLHAQIAYEPFSLQGDEWAREFAPVIRLLKESIEIWRGLPQELGADLEVSLQGGLIVARTAAEMRMLERKAALERSVGLEVELLSRADLLARAPYLAESIIGGTFCAIEGKANPLRAAPAFAAAAERLGARIERRAEVVGISRRERGGFHGARPRPRRRRGLHRQGWSGRRGRWWTRQPGRCAAAAAGSGYERPVGGRDAG